jgi:hypothetical protein
METIEEHVYGEVLHDSILEHEKDVEGGDDE